MGSKVPRWVADPPPEDSRFARMSPDERLGHFVRACELAAAILRERGDAAEVLARRAPLSPETEARWLALVAEGRRARAA